MLSVVCLILLAGGLLCELAPEPAPPVYRATARQRRQWRRERLKFNPNLRG